MSNYQFQPLVDPTANGGGGGGGLESFNGRTAPDVVPEAADYADLLLPYGDSTDFAASGLINCTVFLPGRFSYQLLRDGVIRLCTWSNDLGAIVSSGAGNKQLAIVFDNLDVMFENFGFGTVGGYLNMLVGQQDTISGGVISWQPMPAVSLFKQAGSVSGSKVTAGFQLPTSLDALGAGINLFFCLEGILQRRYS